MTSREFFEQVLHLTDTEALDALVAVSVVRTFRAGELILRAGDPVTEVSFLISGALRSFYFDAAGREITDCFAARFGTPTVPSFLEEKALSPINLEALTATELLCVPVDVALSHIAQNTAYYDVFHVPEFGMRIIREGEENLAADALYLYNTPEGAYNFNCPLDGQVIVGELHESDRAVPQLAEKPYRSGAVVWYPVVLADGSTGWLWSNPENDENSVNVVYALAGPQTEALVQAEVDQHWYRFLPRPLIDLSAQFFRAVPLWFGFSFHAA